MITFSAPELDFPVGKHIIEHVSHLGVLLLLFTVGLKLNIRSLGKPEVLGGQLLHFVVSAPCCTRR